MSSAAIDALLRDKAARREVGRRPHWTLVLWGGLCGLGFVTLVPIVWMVLSSFKSRQEVLTNPPTLVPHAWHADNFSAAWEFAPFGRFLINSFVMSGGITVLQVITSALAAYAFARLRFRGRDLIFLLYLATLMIPAQVTII